MTTLPQPTTCKLTHLSFPSSDPSTHFVHILHNLLTKEECEEIIASHTNLEESNLTPGTVRTREMFEDRVLVGKLWERMRGFYEGEAGRVRDEWGEWWRVRRLNEGVRLSRYVEGGKFTAHFDYSRELNDDEQTFMSVNIYLNTVPDEMKGATRVLRHTEGMDDYWDGVEELVVLARIQPVLGTASVFRDTLWHDGEELLGGEKYLLRTDIVYEREGKEGK